MLLDAHTHLDIYKDNLDSVIREITENKIFTIAASMDLPSYVRNKEIAKQSSLIVPALGVHPWNAHKHTGKLEDFKEAVEESPLFGEIGLDYHWVEAEHHAAQREVFEFFLSEARKQKKIVNLHTKAAEKDVLLFLRSYSIERAIVHWYSGPLDIMKKLLDHGAYFTLGIEIMHTEHIQTIAQEIPPDRLLTETDNPGGAKFMSGTPGMPVIVKDVIKKLAELRKTTEEDIIETVWGNFIQLVKNDKWMEKYVIGEM